MRIALVGPVYPFRGGIAHYTTMLYEALCASGHDVLLISFKRQYPRWLFPGASDRDPSQQALKVSKPEYILSPFNPVSWLRGVRAIVRFKADILVLQWWTVYWALVWNVLGLLNRVLMHAELVYICHNVLSHEKRWWDGWMARSTLRWGDRIFVQSDQEQRVLGRLLPMAAVTVRALPIYGMLATKNLPTKEEARRSLSIPSDGLTLLFFGIVRSYKGLRYLIEALPKLQSRLGEVRLLVAGEFWDDPESYQVLIQKLGLEDTVVIRDEYIPNEEVPVYFSAADILVAPYVAVTGSGVVQMAWGFGLPFVATWSVAAEESSGVPYVVAAPADPLALADAIVELQHTIQKSPAPSLIRSQQQASGSWQELARAVVGNA